MTHLVGYLANILNLKKRGHKGQIESGLLGMCKLRTDTHVQVPVWKDAH